MKHFAGSVSAGSIILEGYTAPDSRKRERNGNLHRRSWGCFASGCCHWLHGPERAVARRFPLVANSLRRAFAPWQILLFFWKRCLLGLGICVQRLGFAVEPRLARLLGIWPPTVVRES